MVIFGLGVLLTLLILILTPMVYRGAWRWCSGYPTLSICSTTAKVCHGSRRSSASKLELDAGAIRKWLARQLGHRPGRCSALLLARAPAGGLALVGVVADLFLVPLVMFYLLQEWPRILALSRGLGPAAMARRTTKLLAESTR